MEEFGYSYSNIGVLHQCCDICAANCKCGSAKCGKMSLVTSHDVNTESLKRLDGSCAVRAVNSSDKAKLKELLIKFKKELIDKGDIWHDINCWCTKCFSGIWLASDHTNLTNMS
jgi:hypothetical protein